MITQAPNFKLTQEAEESSDTDQEVNICVLENFPLIKILNT